MANMREPKDQVKDLPSIPSSLQPHRVPRLGKVGEVPSNENKNKRK